MNSQSSKNKKFTEDLLLDQLRVKTQSGVRDSARPMPSLLNPASITPTKSGTANSPLVGMGRGRGLANILNIADRTADDTSQIVPCEY